MLRPVMENSIALACIIHALPGYGRQHCSFLHHSYFVRLSILPTECQVRKGVNLSLRPGEQVPKGFLP